MNSNSLIQEWKQTEEKMEKKTIMEIALYSANVGSRAHEVAQYEIKSTDSWKTRVQNNFTQFRTLENVLPKTLGNNISKYDIFCHQEVTKFCMFVFFHVSDNGDPIEKKECGKEHILFFSFFLQMVKVSGFNIS